MQNSKNVWIALVVVAIIAITAFVKDSKEIVVERQLGSQVGPEHYNAQTFYGGSVSGNVISTSTTDTAYTMVAGDLLRNGVFPDTYIHHKSGAVATTTNTLVASTSLTQVLPRAGMRTDICFVVATSTGGAGMILAEGTGWNIVVASSTRVQTGSGLAPAGAVSRTVTGGQPSCGYIIRERAVSSSPGFVDATSTTPGNFTLFLTPSYPVQ